MFLSEIREGSTFNLRLCKAYEKRVDFSIELAEGTVHTFLSSLDQHLSTFRGFPPVGIII